MTTRADAPQAAERLDLSLYLVTDTELCGARGVPRTVREAVAGGATMVQVRDPRATGRQLCELVTAVRAELADIAERPIGAGFPDGAGLPGGKVPLLVDDRLDVALAAGADGVHLGQSDVPPQQARRIAPELLIGWSVSDARELAETAEFPPGTVDYLGIGPVFGTPTKPEAAPALGVAGLRELTAATELPAVAIGGVHAGNAAEIAATGVRGLCVVSEICAAADPASAAARLRKVHR